MLEIISQDYPITSRFLSNCISHYLEEQEVSLWQGYRKFMEMNKNVSLNYGTTNLNLFYLASTSTKSCQQNMQLTFINSFLPSSAKSQLQLNWVKTLSTIDPSEVTIYKAKLQIKLSMLYVGHLIFLSYFLPIFLMIWWEALKNKNA